MKGARTRSAGAVQSVVAALLAAGFAVPATAQVSPPDSTASPPSVTRPPATGGWAGWAAVPHPWSTVAAVTVVLPAGSAEDAEARGGTAWLLGQISADAIRDRLGAGTVRVDVHVGRTRTVYRVLAVPDAWTRAYRAVEDVLFDASGAPPGLEQARASLLAVHTFEAGAPVREFEREVHRLLSGPAAPWSRTPRGSAESVAEISPADVESHRRAHYRRGNGFVSVTGAVLPDEVARVVAGAGPAEGPPGEARVAVRETPELPSGPAWAEGERIRQVRDVTSGWIAAAWPVDPAVSRTATEMLVHRIRSELVTEPPSPGLFSADIELEDLPGGRTALLVQVAVLPESVDDWEARIVETMGRISSAPLEAGFFRFHRRQFRNLRLVDDAGPEDEGLRVALDVQREGSPRDLATEIWALDPAALHEAATALGPPRILVFGPDLSAGGGPRAPRPRP